MLLKVKDASGSTQQVVAQAQDNITDLSNTITTTGVSQQLAPANPNRSGFYFQNNGENNMTLSEIGSDATVPGAIVVRPTESFPPAGYPVPVGIMNVAGTAGDTFTFRVW